MQTRVRIIRRTKTNRENARNEFDYLGCHESVSVPEPGPSVAGQPVRSFRTRNVTGCPGSQEVFHPLFKPHCYAPLETLLTTFARPTSSRLFDPKQLIGALWIWNIRYRRISKGAYFENDLNLRKGERRAQVEFRSSRLSQFRSKPVIILIYRVSSWYKL